MKIEINLKESENNLRHKIISNIESYLNKKNIKNSINKSVNKSVNKSKGFFKEIYSNKFIGSKTKKYKLNNIYPDKIIYYTIYSLKDKNYNIFSKGNFILKKLEKDTYLKFFGENKSSSYDENQEYLFNKDINIIFGIKEGDSDYLLVPQEITFYEIMNEAEKEQEILIKKEAKIKEEKRLSNIEILKKKYEMLIAEKIKNISLNLNEQNIINYTIFEEIKCETNTNNTNFKKYNFKNINYNSLFYFKINKIPNILKGNFIIKEIQNEKYFFNTNFSINFGIIDKDYKLFVPNEITFYNLNSKYRSLKF